MKFCFAFGGQLRVSETRAEYCEVLRNELREDKWLRNSSTLLQRMEGLGNISKDVRNCLTEILSSVDEGNALVFYGAGVSRNSGLPVVNQLVPYILDKLDFSKEDREFILDESWSPKMPFELFIQCLKLSCNIDKLLEIFGLGLPNTNHFLLAHLVKLGKLRTIVTTNFDQLLETALETGPNALVVNRDFDVISEEQSFDQIDWSLDRIRVIKIHGSVDNLQSMAMTLKQVASQTLSKPRRGVVQEAFASGKHKDVLILGYSSSDVFDISPHIEDITENQKHVYYLQHPADDSQLPKVEDLRNEEDKNPFKGYQDGKRLYFNTDKLIKTIWDKFVPGEDYRLINGKTGWKGLVNEWFDENFASYGTSIKFGIRGHLYLEMGEPRTAIVQYSNELGSYDSSIIEPRRYWCMMNLANAYFKKGELEESLKYFNQALKLSEDNNDLGYQAKCLGGLGNVHLVKEQYELARGFYRSALEISKRLDSSDKHGDWLGNLGTIHRHLGEYKEAMELGKESISIAREKGDVQGEIAGLINIGNLHLNQADYSSAKELFEESLSLSTKLFNRQSKAEALGNIANAYNTMGEYGLAKDCYLEAVKIVTDIGNLPKRLTWLGNLGVLYKNIGDYENASKCSNEALGLARSLEDKRAEQVSLGNLGHLCSRKKKHSEAKKFYEEALEASIAAGDKKSEALNHGNIGNVCRSLGEVFEAKKHYKLASELAEKLGNQSIVGLCLGNLGVLARKQGEFLEAIQHLSKALSIANEIGEQASSRIWLNGLAVAYRGNHEYQKAKDCYLEGIELAEKAGDELHQGESLGNIAGLCFLLGSYEEAVLRMEESLAIITPILGTEHLSVTSSKENLIRFKSKLGGE